MAVPDLHPERAAEIIAEQGDLAVFGAEFMAETGIADYDELLSDNKKLRDDVGMLNQLASFSEDVLQVMGRTVFAVTGDIQMNTAGETYFLPQSSVRRSVDAFIPREVDVMAKFLGFDVRRWVSQRPPDPYLGLSFSPTGFSVRDFGIPVMAQRTYIWVPSEIWPS